MDYLMDRKHAAVLFVDALALDGALVNEAVHRSESLRLESSASHVGKLEASMLQGQLAQPRLG